MLANRVRNFTQLRWDEFIKYEHFINFKFQKERAALFINADSLRLFCASRLRKAPRDFSFGFGGGQYIWGRQGPVSKRLH